MMAKTNSQVRRRVREARPSLPLMKCSCGSSLSLASRTAPPSRMAAPTRMPAPQGP
ncbi:Uncharacterised protein [Bordetella pertussis]|nr:Uncharacterised protein [Bordetella pertussis]